MAASHTPGPLAVINSASGMPLIIADHPQHVVCIAKLQDTPEGWATAQLFSAAPDLLEALQALRLAREQDKYRSWDKGVPNFNAAEALADAAIAKATGEKA